MSDLYFITGNAGKLAEVKAILPDVKQRDIDLPELQDSDARNVIAAKLDEASKHHAGGLIVEDTSLYLDCLNGLPGPLIKWFLKALGPDGLFNLADKLGNTSAKAKTIIGYSNGGVLEFFEGVIAGQIVAPRGDNGFGWDAIFQPDGHVKTFAEMEPTEKNAVSMRRLAAEKLKAYLDSQ